MNLVRRTLERRSRRGTRYKYLILPNKLVIQLDNGEEAKRIVVALTHRKRRYECKVRETEACSSTNLHKRLVEWTPSDADTIHFNVTFFKQHNKDQFDDKEWTILVETLDDKDQARTLASCTLNLQKLASRSLEMTLKLQPSCAVVHDCTLTLTFISSMLRGFACFAAADDNTTMYNGAAVIRIPGTQAELITTSPTRIEHNVSTVAAEKDTSGKDSIRLSTISDKSTVADAFSPLNKSVERAEICRPTSTAEEMEEKSRRSVSIDDENAGDNTLSSSKLADISATVSTREVTTKLTVHGGEEMKGEQSVSVVIEPPSLSKVIEELEHMSQRKKEEMQQFRHEDAEERTLRQTEADRQLRLREEARRLMRDALQSTNAQRSFMVRSAHAPKNTDSTLLSIGGLHSSQTDLRTLGESPLLPSFGISPGIIADSSHARSQSASATTADLSDGGTYQDSGTADETQEEELDDDAEEDEHENVRKITSRFEQDVQNPASKIQADLDNIADRIAEVERLDAYIVGQKMKNTEAGSTEEQKFIEQHLRYLTEKEALVRQQDYLNVLIELKETTDKIEKLQRLINQNTTDELLYTNKTETLMMELKKLIDKKDELSHILINKETEEEEEKERSKLLVQQSFVRGTVEPLSASKRILTWFNSPRNNTAAN